MKIWDREAKEWLERDGVDAGDMLRLHADRYSKTEIKDEPAAAPEPQLEATPSPSPKPKKEK